MVMSSTPIPDYKFEQDSSQDEKVVTKAAPAEAYLVEYRDGEGKVQTRLTFRVNDTMFIVQERIQGQHVVTPAVPWFNKSFKSLIDEENDSPSSI